MDDSRIGVCFVCLGNICRSPTAEGIFRSLLEECGLSERILVDSAGTSAWHAGEPADPRSAKVALARGVELTSRSRLFLEEDFGLFHYVLAMDRANLRDLRALAPHPAAEAKIHLFRNFDTESPADADVPDPYAGGVRGFDDVFDICSASALGFLEYLRKNHQRIDAACHLRKKETR